MQSTWTTMTHQQRVGAFFSAIRSLAYTVGGLNIRASVRTDVWGNLRRMEDQDKLRQYITDIVWSDKTLKAIFAKKILSYLQREKYPHAANWEIDRDYSELVYEVFAGQFRLNQRPVEPFSPITI